MNGGKNYNHFFSVADDIVNEAVEGVAQDAVELCDVCVEELYSNEFIRPP